MHCDDRLEDLGTLYVTSKLYVRDNDDDSWSWMTTNRTDCPRREFRQ